MSKGITMMAVAVAVAAGTYFTLEFMFPAQKGTATSSHNTQATDQVFASASEQPAEAVTPAAPPVEPVEVESEAIEAIDVDAAIADTAEDASEPMTEEGAEAGETADEPVAAMDETDARSEPKPAAMPAPAAAVTPKPAPAVAGKPAQKPVPKAPAIAGGSGTSAPRLGGSSSAPAPTWWGQSGPGELGLVYAGSAAYERAIVLMFDGDISSAAAAGKRIRVSNPAGKTVSGSWSVSEKNPRMLLFKVDNPGTYTVSLNSELSDRGGRKLGRSQQGPVTVQ